MTVKDLFSACDKGVLSELFSQADSSGASAEELFTHLEAISPCASGERVILGTEYASFDEELPPMLELTVYQKPDIADNFRQLSFSGNDLTDKEFTELSDAIAAVGGHSPELMAWSDIFGCEVDEDNISFLGKERFMAEIICVMTCYGYSEAEIDRARARAGSSDTDKAITLDKMAMLLFGGELPETDEPLFSAETAANMMNTYNVLSEYYKKVAVPH